MKLADIEPGQFFRSSYRPAMIWLKVGLGDWKKHMEEKMHIGSIALDVASGCIGMWPVNYDGDIWELVNPEDV